MTGNVFGAPKATIWGILIFSLLYPFIALFISHIPNPMVPGACIALNMICPVIAGHLYGMKSGAVTGALGTFLAAFLYNQIFDYYAVVPHAVMGAAAGYTGRYEMELYSPFTIIIGHVLNIIVFLSFGIITIEPGKINLLALGLSTETVIDMVVISVVIIALRNRLYQHRRW